MKFKVDHYRVPGKNRMFDVLVFPTPKIGWAYDDYPEESGPRVDGDYEAFRMFAIVLAGLATDPSKIMYFPLKKEKHPMGFGQTYHFAMLRPELQFRRSQWPRLHAKLDRRHWVGKYTIRHDRKKLDDYFERFRKALPGRLRCAANKSYVEEIRGDTVFMVIPREYCYDFHYDVGVTLDGCYDEDEYSQMTKIGWILPQKLIESCGSKDGK